MSKSEEVPDYCQVMEIRGNDGTVKQLLFPKALDLNRPKRPRTTFSNEQLKKLDIEFENNPYLVGNERKQLANDLGLSETQVKVWFQNKRTKLKHRPESEQPIDKNANIPSKHPTECNNNDQSTMNKLPQMSNFQMFPMHQWLMQTNIHHPEMPINNNKTDNFNLFF